MLDYNMKPFRFWCQKVLPLAYDDSLSYYEVLCKVVNYLNHIIEDINSIPDYIRQLIDDEHLEPLLSGLLDTLREQIASANEGLSETATADRKNGELVWLNGILVRMTRAVQAGDRYVINTGEVGVTGNCVKYTIENTIGDLEELTTENKISIVGAIDEIVTALSNETSAREEADAQLGLDIGAEATARENADTQLGLDIGAEATARENADNLLNNDIQHLRHFGNKANILLIGDSYLDINTTSWGDIVIEGLHKTLGSTAFKSAKGGAGFSASNSGKSFNDLINDAYDNIEVPNDISLVVIGGGYNDFEKQTLETDIINTLTNCKSKFPNAEIMVFNISGGVQGLEGRMYVDSTYNRGCALSKVAYSQVGNVLKVYSDCMNTTDLTHPNEKGQQMLGGTILSHILGVPNTYNANYIQVTNTLGANMYLTMNEKDSIINVLSSSSVIDVTMSSSGELNGSTLIGEFTMSVADRINVLSGANLSYVFATGSCVVSVNSGQYVTGSVKVLLTDSKIKLYITSIEIGGGYMRFSSGDTLHIGALEFSNTIPTIML